MKRTSVFLIFACLMACSDPSVTTQSPATDGVRNYTGSVRSYQQSYLSPPSIDNVWSYKLLRMTAEGTEVAAGDPVVWFDPADPRRRMQERASRLQTRQQNVEQKRLEVEQKIEQYKLDMAEAQMNLEKAREKAEINDPVMPEIERKTYALDAAIANERVKEIEAKIAQVEGDFLADTARDEAFIVRMSGVVSGMRAGIAQMQLTSPQAGVLLYEKNSNGEPFSTGDEAYRSVAVVSISDLNFMEVSIAIPEREIRFLDLEQNVEINIDGIEDQTWIGTVKSVAGVYRTENSRVLVDVVVEVLETDPEFVRPGLTASVRFKELAR